MRISTSLLAFIAAAMIPVLVLAQSPIAPAIGPSAVPQAGPIAPIAPEARDLLKMLHDRKNTLKDFYADIDYSVKSPIDDSLTGKTGKVSFLVDPNRGPIFSADFDVNTVEGKPRAKYHVQFIFDGKNPHHQRLRSGWHDQAVCPAPTVLPPGRKSSGDAVSLQWCDDPSDSGWMWMM